MLLILIIILCIIELCLLIPRIVKNFREKAVRESSLLYNGIDNFNDKYRFNNLTESFDYACSSKSQYDKFNVNQYFVNLLLDDDNWLINLIEKELNNNKLFEQYNDEFTLFMNDSDYHYDVSEVVLAREKTRARYAHKKWFQNAEDSVCFSKRQNPPLDLKVIIRYFYETPKAQKRYVTTCTYNRSQAVILLQEAAKIQKNRQSSQYQRTLLTPALRYEILKRDNFKCQICGATQYDGVKLHVDHIVPVSKGGKTVASNLRVLCDSCNLGKRDRYDPNGVN